MKVLNAKRQGIPQSRPRTYVVAIHGSCYAQPFEFPEDAVSRRAKRNQIQSDNKAIK